jgi:hypothetical protein
MNIIFGRDNAVALSEKYTVLELDTIKFGPDGPEVTAFCAVENIPIFDMPKVESMKTLHENLLVEYRKRNWNYCTQALEHLTGFWGHELDTFYNSISSRVTSYTESDPGDEWTGVIEKNIT